MDSRKGIQVETQTRLFRSLTAALLTVTLLTTAAEPQARADAEADIAITAGVVSGLGLGTAIVLSIALSRNRFVDHVKNERGPSRMDATDGLDSSLKQAFVASGESGGAAVESAARLPKIIPTVAVIPGHGTAPATAAGGLVGVF